MNITYSSIGTFRCEQVEPIEAPRQGTLVKNLGEVHLLPEIDLHSLRDLEGFDFIWLLYHFHHNNSWSPTVRPPRGSEKKRGVFATRSPYRPNSIGLSCVQLVRIQDRKLIVTGHDLLDKTPILDIKPYLVYADSFPEAKQGWLEELVHYHVVFRIHIQERLDWLSQRLDKDLRSLLVQQLSVEPTNSKIKRVKPTKSGFEYSYKTWRFGFQRVENRIEVVSVSSGYKPQELSSQDDVYGDKKLHLSFLELWPESH